MPVRRLNNAVLPQLGLPDQGAMRGTAPAAIGLMRRALSAAQWRTRAGRAAQAMQGEDATRAPVRGVGAERSGGQPISTCFVGDASAELAAGVRAMRHRSAGGPSIAFADGSAPGELACRSSVGGSCRRSK